jgi:uncharacterized membrane protein YphA (DoxX/SURF4 family)
VSRLAGEIGDIRSVAAAKASHEGVEVVSPTASGFGFNSTKVLSGARILFGAIFLFDGILKWDLYATGQLQGIVQGYGVSYLSNNWLLFGLLVACGETLAGGALLVGLFQRPAAIAATTIMMFIWGYGNLQVTGNYLGVSTGYTDPGGDLMLALVFGVLIFAPSAYGLASRYHLAERFSATTWTGKFARFLVG